MKYVKQIILKSSILILILFTLNACSKKKFEKRPTVIEIDVSHITSRPIHLEHISLIIGIKDIVENQKSNEEFNLFNTNTGEWYTKILESVEADDNSEIQILFGDEISMTGGKIQIVIKWNFLNRYIEPWNNEVTLMLLDQGFPGSYPNDVNFLNKVWSTSVAGIKMGEVSTNLKAAMTYKWDLQTNTIEETGEKTEKNDFYDKENSEESGTSSNVDGRWMRGDGGSYLKFSGTSVYLCNSSSLQEFTGTYDAASKTATITEGTTVLEFIVNLQSDGNIMVEQYVSSAWQSTETYYPSTDYPCN